MGREGPQIPVWLSWAFVILLIEGPEARRDLRRAPNAAPGLGTGSCPRATLCTVTRNLPSQDSGCPQPGPPMASGKGCPNREPVLRHMSPKPLGGGGRCLWSPGMAGDRPGGVFSLRVTSRVRMSQDWALGHARPQGCVPTKPSLATSSLTGRAGLPWGSRRSPDSQAQSIKTKMEKKEV